MGLFNTEKRRLQEERRRNALDAARARASGAYSPPPPQPPPPMPSATHESPSPSTSDADPAIGAQNEKQFAAEAKKTSPSRVDEIIARMPEKERGYAERDRVIEAEGSMGDEPILAIIRSSFPFGTMIVSDRRLIIVLQDGGLQVISYSEISRVEVLAGNKGMRGRKRSMLVISIRGGDRYEMTIGASDGDYSLLVCKKVERAFSTFAVRNS
jgi:hypothetical protein